MPAARPEPDISIVVPCRNERPHIDAFFRSVAKQDFKTLRWEMIVADGMSDDGTREALDAACTSMPELTVIDNPEGIVSTGLNRAIHKARGRYILRFDMHTEYADDYVPRCVDQLEVRGVDNVGGPARTRPSGYIGMAISAAYHSPFSCGGAAFHNLSYTGYVDTVPYGCWRKSTLVRLGLFDEQLVRNQDDELNLRLVRSGGKIWQDPQIISWYHPRSSLLALWQQYFQYGFWKIPVIRKHKLPASWRHLAPGTFLAVNIIALITALVQSASGTFPLHALLVVLGLVAPYAIACIVASIAASLKYGIHLLPVLPVIFAVFHFSYGLGFMIGLLCCPWHGGGVPRSRLFTMISR